MKPGDPVRRKGDATPYGTLIALPDLGGAYVRPHANGVMEFVEDAHQLVPDDIDNVLKSYPRLASQFGRPYMPDKP